MYRCQSIQVANIPDGTAISNEITVKDYAWLIIETPSGSEAAAITIQLLSGDGSTYIDAFTLADVTNRIKGMSSEEIAKFGPMQNIRLKLGSNVTGDKRYYCHLST